MPCGCVLTGHYQLGARVSLRRFITTRDHNSYSLFAGPPTTVKLSASIRDCCHFTRAYPPDAGKWRPKRRRSRRCVTGSEVIPSTCEIGKYCTTIAWRQCKPRSWVSGFRAASQVSPIEVLDNRFPFDLCQFALPPKEQIQPPWTQRSQRGDGCAFVAQ